MSPRTWKSSSTLSSRRALRSSPARSIGVLLPGRRGAEQVERRQRIIVAEREAGLAGGGLALARVLALRRGGGDRLGRVGRPRPRGASAAARRPSSSRAASRSRLRRGGLGGDRVGIAAQRGARPVALLGAQAEREIAERQPGDRQQAPSATAAAALRSPGLPISATSASTPCAAGQARSRRPSRREAR